MHTWSCPVARRHVHLQVPYSTLTCADEFNEGFIVDVFVLLSAWHLAELLEAN